MTQILSTVYETETVGTGTETNNNNRDSTCPFYESVWGLEVNA